MGAQASERLLNNSEKIMHNWEMRAKEEIFAATHQETLLLRNDLPSLLLHLANALSTTVDKTALHIRWNLEEGTRLARLHGLTRAGQAHYTIDQLIFEYHILRQVITEVMEKEEALSSIETEIITSTFEQSVNDAATEFSTALTNIQQLCIQSLVHDLRSPVTAAKIIAQQLQRKLTGDELMAERITKNMNRIDLMIQDLLDVGRLNAGEQLPLGFVQCDLDKIIEQIIEDLNFIYNNRFKYISSGECLGLWSEKGIKRLIENLAINAIKYGSVDSDIIIALDDSGEEIILSVHNEGAPIPLKDQENLFDQYHRPRYSEERTGWGLGLAIVQAMANAHNGVVGLESDEGKGTTFTVKFPKSYVFNNIQSTQYSSHV